jgi:hypothetical protein
MWLVRAFQTPSWFNNWHEKKPTIEVLLRCFDREKSDADPVSAFWACTAADELECAAAHFQSFSRTDFAQHFIVRFSSDECRRAGIITEPAANEGLTGVVFVDAKHFNLKGTTAQFSELIKNIVGRIWVGEERLRLFPIHQLRYQTVIFSQMPEHLIEKAASERCEKLLSKYQGQHRFSEKRDRITISGDLCDKQSAALPVQAEMRINLTRQASFRVLVSRFLYQLYRYVN